MTPPKSSRRLVGYAMLAGALVMGVTAALLRAGVIGDAGGAGHAISFVLGGIAALDAAIGTVLIVRS